MKSASPRLAFAFYVAVALPTAAMAQYTAPAPYVYVPQPLPPTNNSNPGAYRQNYINSLPTQQVQRCTLVPNGNGGYIQRCY